MKIGLSSYSLYRALLSGQMNLLDIVDWTAQNGGEHLEVVDLGTQLANDKNLAKEIAERAKANGIALSSYTVGANFITESEEAFEKEVQRILNQVEIAAILGVKRMRHDAGSRPVEETTQENFDADLPQLIAACQTIADYAARYDIVTSVENHGYHLQASERVLRLIAGVNRENFRTTLDIGNFLCVDEDSIASTKNNISYASMVHFKDFYRRHPNSNPGEGWFRSKAGYHLRGAIVGHGDIDIPAVAEIIKSSGYDGFVSLEFEGMEECTRGTKIGLDNLKRYLS